MPYKIKFTKKTDQNGTTTVTQKRRSFLPTELKKICTISTRNESDNDNDVYFTPATSDSRIGK